MSLNQYMENQAPEICMAAVKQNGWNIQYVKDQTPEICLEAVKQDGRILRMIQAKNHTLEISLAAIRQDRNAFRYVISKYMKECWKELNLDATVTQ